MIRQYLTSRQSGASLEEQQIQPAPSDSAPGASLFVDPELRFQTIEGFGGAFTEASAVTWQQLDEERRAEVLQAYFAQDDGHAYSMCRVHMNSCDFALGNYAHLAAPGDVELRDFNMDRDRQALLPFIQAALQVAKRPIKLMVSPWSPPAWMKSNGEMNHGGKLLPEFRTAWARCFVRFIQEYEAAGVPIWGVSVQNEPAATQRWDSCIYSAEEERDFVRDHLGPELEAAGLGRINIIIWDHNRDLMVERAAVVYADPHAARFVWGTGFHWYGDNHFDHVQLHHDAWPDKKLLFTEGCQEGGPHTGSWALGERYAQSMINDLNRWTVGWIDWNLLLNAQGGPNHVGNLCSAPLLLDATGQRIERQSSYYYLGHFTRFVQPGAQRILCSASAQNLECTAFVNPDGSIAVIAMNRTEQPIAVQLSVGAQQYALELPARSIATYQANKRPSLPKASAQAASGNSPTV